LQGEDLLAPGSKTPEAYHLGPVELVAGSEQDNICVTYYVQPSRIMSFPTDSCMVHIYDYSVTPRADEIYLGLSKNTCEIHDFNIL